MILAAVGVWLAGNWIAPALGVPGTWAIALDLACLAALGWALVKAVGLMRAGSVNE